MFVSLEHSGTVEVAYVRSWDHMSVVLDVARNQEIEMWPACCGRGIVQTLLLLIFDFQIQEEFERTTSGKVSVANAPGLRTCAEPITIQRSYLTQCFTLLRLI